MIVFWSIAGGMLAAALGFVLAPLLREAGGVAPASDAVNLDIHGQRLTEPADDEADAAEAKERHQELTRSLPSDPSGRVASRGGGRPCKRTAAVIAVILPVAAVGLYLQLGTMSMLDRPLEPASAAQSAQAARLEGMVEHLTAHLQRRPEDAEGWGLLGWIYLRLGRYGEASPAFAKAYELAGDEPDVLVGYARALAAGGDLAGRPAELLTEALAIDPDHPRGRWLAGTAAFQRGDYRQALIHWRRLSRLRPDNDTMQRALRPAIAEAEARLKRRD